MSGSAMQQCADAVLMCRPARFGFNAQTAASNAFQHAATEAQDGAAGRAVLEFDRLRGLLVEAGVRVATLEDTPDPVKPDAVFPNNWLSLHADGTAVLYPMQAANRRLERRGAAALELVRSQLGFRATRCLDYSGSEAEGRYLEGTGSMVLDHVQRVAYACLSPRTDAELFHRWCRELQYEPVLFTAVDRAGRPLYHTNVVMWIGTQVVAIGAGNVVAADRARVLARLAASGRQVLELTATAIESFAGNMLELAGEQGRTRVLAMSLAAHAALGTDERAQLAQGVDRFVVADIPTIEALGGGSVRCMLAEVPRT